MAENDGLDELRSALRDKRLVPVVGAGVSVAAAKLPGWSGLIRHGIDFAEACGGCDAQCLSTARASLDAGRLLNAAQGLKTLLRAPGGQYEAWLKSVFMLSHDAIVSKQTLNRIADLLCPIVATTNYDDLLEQMLLDRYDPVTWQEPQKMLNALKDGRAVFHLHGIYRAPESVVLGADNYADLVGNSAYRAVLQTLWIDRTLLFIGCSFDGLQDPDFSRMLEWFSQTFPRASTRHFALMLDGSYTTEQQAAWLHDLRVQVIPYGPTHDHLSVTLRTLNVNAEQAYVRRMYLSKSLLESDSPKEVPKLVAVLEGVSISGLDPKLRKAAETLLEKGRDERSRQRQNLSAMQLLTRSLVDPEEIAAEMRKWDRGKTKFEGRFRETVQRAAGALFLFDTALLNAMHLRCVNIHHNVLTGMCREYLELLDKISPERIAVMPSLDYPVENMNRILTTLHAILEARPEEVFIDPKVGSSSQESLDGSLLVLRSDCLELRKCASPKGPFACLPLEMSALGGSFERLNEKNVVIAYTSGNVIAWDPTISMPIAAFSVDSAYGINSVDHQRRQGTLESIVATTDGMVYRLRDLGEIDAWRPKTKGFLADIVTLQNDRVFALSNANEFPLVELEGEGCRDRLTPSQLAEQLAQWPILGDHWEARLKEESEWYGKRYPIPPEEDTLYRLTSRFQHLRLRKIKIEGNTLLALQVQLSFHISDEVVLLLDPNHDPLRVVGYFLLREQQMADFDLHSRHSGELSLVGALLSDAKMGYDLAIWATGAKTAQGIIFVQKGSTLRTKDDLIRVTHAEGTLCFAADDSGGLFQFSTRDRRWQEIDRQPESRITGLRFRK